MTAGFFYYVRICMITWIINLSLWVELIKWFNRFKQTPSAYRVFLLLCKNSFVNLADICLDLVEIKARISRFHEILDYIVFHKIFDYQLSISYKFELVNPKSKFFWDLISFMDYHFLLTYLYDKIQRSRLRHTLMTRIFILGFLWQK